MDKIKKALRKISEANGNCMVSLTYEGDYPGNWSIIVGTRRTCFLILICLMLLISLRTTMKSLTSTSFVGLDSPHRGSHDRCTT